MFAELAGGFGIGSVGMEHEYLVDGGNQEQEIRYRHVIFEEFGEFEKETNDSIFMTRN